jgi:hypothetical protein
MIDRWKSVKEFDSWPQHILDLICGNCNHRFGRHSDAQCTKDNCDCKEFIPNENGEQKTGGTDV